MKITLIHPSRGRAYKALDTFTAWKNVMGNNIEVEYILSLDSNDTQLELYLSLFLKVCYSEYKNINVKILTNDNSSVVEATNKAAKASTGDILIYLSDDFKCPENWDKLITERLHNNSPALLKVDDCLQKFAIPVLTIPIMNSKLYERLGYFWNPLYKSMFVDEDLFWVCNNNGWLIEAPDLKFPHEHCCNGKAENDETYKRSAANWDQGKAVYAKRKAEGFPV